MDVLSAVQQAKNYITHALAAADRLQIGADHDTFHYFYLQEVAQ